MLGVLIVCGVMCLASMAFMALVCIVLGRVIAREGLVASRLASQFAFQLKGNDDATVPLAERFGPPEEKAAASRNTRNPFDAHLMTARIADEAEDSLMPLGGR